MDIKTEGYVFSEKPFYYKLDLWKENKTNKLFIIGISGSGKTTLGKELSKKYNCRFISLDKLNEDLNDMLDKQLPKTMPDSEFFKHLKKEVYNYVVNIKEKAIIEGVQIMYQEQFDFNYIKKYPVIVLNTSLLLSMYRAFKRNLNRRKDVKKLKSMAWYKILIDIIGNNKRFLTLHKNFVKKLQNEEKGEKQ